MSKYSDEEMDGDSGGGLGEKIKNFFRFRRDDEFVDDEEEYDSTPPPSARTMNPIVASGNIPRPPVAQTTFSTAPRKEQSIATTRAMSFADAERVALRLKGGEPQIVNFERTAPDMAIRLIDFLNGAAFAIGGAIEQVGESGVYLFTPPSVVIHSDEPETRPASGPSNAKTFFNQLGE